jgi:hypothetical protein
MKPEPVAMKPEPVAMKPEPVAMKPEPVAMKPEPVVKPEHKVQPKRERDSVSATVPWFEQAGGTRARPNPAPAPDKK